ncbi:sodium:proton antiporter [Helcococcus ovis]|uniref:Sodium:proton antiporter n=1 Tax=Helcococcus ovis TaxID=72026 RepID=A0A4V3IY87_9FIRM|nr:cation:proton antiporter [Helcococcus ovis]TFF64200.1 sodium:proton antiporter [Helcococcus ovis]TFF65679.1 sodium:proton antiporter [Helcococcus ovis]
MIISLAIIFLCGLIFAKISEIFKLPRLLGMLIAGILIGPFVFNLIDLSVLRISSDLRKIALVVILIRAGLTLDFKKVVEVGRPALLMSFLPATFEILAYTFLAKFIFGIDVLSAAIMGAILSAVSPAVVVPGMINVIEKGYGNKKGIGQLVLAGASLDDVFVLAIFSSLIGFSTGGNFSVYKLLDIPISIVSGIFIGAIIGYVLSIVLSKIELTNNIKVLFIFATSILLVGLKNEIGKLFAFSEMLSVMTLALVYSLKSENDVIYSLKNGFSGIWSGFEVLLFVLIGAQVDIRYTLGAGALGLLLIFATLVFRTLAVNICLIGTNLNLKERMFCMISYFPKATVQAAIGAIPLSLGLPNGTLILSIAVLGILITAPVGAIGIETTYRKLLRND